MTDENLAAAEAVDVCAESPADFPAPHAPAIPVYLQDNYWWAYLHPRSVWLFEREWIVNLILWGNMRRLTAEALAEIDPDTRAPVLQVACVYGDFSARLAAHLRHDGAQLHIVDIAPIQLSNARAKLQPHDNVSLHLQDSSALHFPAASFGHVVLFFLLHEQPEDVRRRTIAEAVRVTRPGGKVVIVDYHGPGRANPLRYLMRPVLRWLEPFALDLWRNEVRDFLPRGVQAEQVTTSTYCGGLYQKTVLRC